MFSPFIVRLYVDGKADLGRHLAHMSLGTFLSVVVHIPRTETDYIIIMILDVNESNLHCFQSDKVTTNETIQDVTRCQTNEVSRKNISLVLLKIHLLI